MTHRPFQAIDLDRGSLDPARMPHCWVQMEQQCDAAAQQKLVDYVRAGGRLALIGRMCIEDFHHQPCTILKDAVGIAQIISQPPFSWHEISAFQYADIPVSFLETYAGGLGEVIARDKDGGTVGFIQSIGKGEILVFGASMTANTLDDLDVLNQMALCLGCPSAFTLSNWADVRLSRGENGSFLFINNYKDDPVTTDIRRAGEPLFGGTPVTVAARSGLILPLDWHLNPNVTVHYITSEIVSKEMDAAAITLKTAASEFTAELTLTGYACDQSSTILHSGERQRIHVRGKDGLLVLRKL